MSDCISCGCRSDIASFDIADHNKIFGFTVIYGLFKGHKTRNTELLVHGDLWFYCRDQVIHMVYDLFVILPDGFCCSFQCLTVFFKCTFLDMSRYIGKHRIESYYDRCMCFLDLLDQFLNHNLILSSVDSHICCVERHLSFYLSL